MTMIEVIIKEDYSAHRDKSTALYVVQGKRPEALLLFKAPRQVGTNRIRNIPEAKRWGPSNRRASP